MTGTMEYQPNSKNAAQAGSATRLPQLDALRGLAALSVFWYHAFGMFPGSPQPLDYIRGTPLGILFDGRAAVLLFFVLSGFVLNLKFVGAKEQSPLWSLDFIIRRLFRIYPAFLIATLVAFFFKMMVFDPVQAFSIYPEGFAKEWKHAVSGAEIVQFLSLLWPGLKLELNPPAWSLVVEMRISLLFPLVIVAVKRWPRLFGNVLLLASAYAVGFIFAHVSTLRYLPHFLLGAIAARHAVAIFVWIRGRALLTRIAWFVISFGLYGATSLAPAVPSWSPPSKFLIEQVAGLGAVGLILFCGALASPSGIMGSRPFRFIGATSYSVYLLHIPFLYGLGFWLLKTTHSSLATWIVVLASTYLFAYLVFTFIEAPMNYFGHRCARWMVARQSFPFLFRKASEPAKASSLPTTADIRVVE